MTRRGVPMGGSGGGGGGGATLTNHAGQHIAGGSDAINADLLDISYITHTNYTADTSIAEASLSTHLAAHLAGINNKLGDLSGASGITGPVSSTNNALTVWDGTGGDTVKNSSVTLDASANMGGIATLGASGAVQFGSTLSVTGAVDFASTLTVVGAVSFGSSLAIGGALSGVTTLTTSGNIVVGGTVDGRDVATDGTKLDGIEASADVTDATNVAAAGAFMADGSVNASGAFNLNANNVTGVGTLTTSGNVVIGGTLNGRNLSTDASKLDGIEALADVTDAANVAAAGAVMDSDFSGSNVGVLRRTGAGSYSLLQDNLVATGGPTATDDAGQGYAVGSLWMDTSGDDPYLCADATTDAAVWVQLNAGGGATDHGALTGLADDDHTQYLLVSGSRSMTGSLNLGSNAITGVTTLTTSGNIVVGGTVDGRDVATDGTKLDGIEALADVTDATNVAAAGAFMANGSVNASGGFNLNSNSITGVTTLTTSGNVVVGGTVDGRDVATDGAKLDGIEALADVTDATNVAAAGAVMDSDFSGSNIGVMTRTGAGAYAVIQHNLTATAAPGTGNDNTQGYGVGSDWYDVTADEAYVCLDASTGAAVWKRTTVTSGGGSSGPRTVGHLGTFTTSNNYETATNVLTGGTGFTVCVLARMKERPGGGAFQVLYSYMQSFTGWAINIDSATIQFRAGGLALSWGSFSSAPNSPNAMKSMLIHATYDQSGGAGAGIAQVWVNGHKVTGATTGTWSAPASGTVASLGSMNGSANAFTSGWIMGAAYHGSVLSDGHIRAHVAACYDAEGMTDGVGFTWNNLWHVAATDPGATLVAINGSVNFTENGSVSHAANSIEWL